MREMKDKNIVFRLIMYFFVCKSFGHKTEICAIKPGLVNGDRGGLKPDWVNNKKAFRCKRCQGTSSFN